MPPKNTTYLLFNKLESLQNVLLTPESFLFIAWRWSMNVASGGRLDNLLVFLEEREEVVCLFVLSVCFFVCFEYFQRRDSSMIFGDVAQSSMAI